MIRHSLVAGPAVRHVLPLAALSSRGHMSVAADLRIACFRVPARPLLTQH